MYVIYNMPRNISNAKTHQKKIHLPNLSKRKKTGEKYTLKTSS